MLQNVSGLLIKLTWDLYECFMVHAIIDAWFNSHSMESKLRATPQVLPFSPFIFPGRSFPFASSYVWLRNGGGKFPLGPMQSSCFQPKNPRSNLIYMHASKIEMERIFWAEYGSFKFDVTWKITNSLQTEWGSEQAYLYHALWYMIIFKHYTSQKMHWKPVLWRQIMMILAGKSNRRA